MRSVWIVPLALLALMAAGSSVPASDKKGALLVRLAAPGPWASVSQLIGYGGRLWFVNSVKFRNHNSADLYSFDPSSKTVRYERHLFSQDSGIPTLHEGLLYWPFEDARFSGGWGEFLVTNGEDWQWRMVTSAEIFHIHAMASHKDALYAATGAWRGGLQRSLDRGRTWQSVYDHPTPQGRVSRLTELVSFAGDLYAALNARAEEGAKLLRWTGAGFEPAEGWPPGRSVDALTVFSGKLYAVNRARDGRSLWRFDGKTSEPVPEMAGREIRDLAVQDGKLWTITAADGGGGLWRSDNGLRWEAVQRFEDREPFDLGVLGGSLYLGVRRAEGQGELWGPAEAPAPNSQRLVRSPLPRDPADEARGLALVAELGEVLRGQADLDAWHREVDRLLFALPHHREAAVGEALAELLSSDFPARPMTVIGGQVHTDTAEIGRWFLLWAIGMNGQGRVPVALLQRPWDKEPNRSEKYFGLVPAAIWAAGMTGQDDAATLAALAARLDKPGEPLWLRGDAVGALTAITGEHFGYDPPAWRHWLNQRRESE